MGVAESLLSVPQTPLDTVEGIYDPPNNCLGGIGCDNRSPKIEGPTGSVPIVPQMRVQDGPGSSCKGPLCRERGSHKVTNGAIGLIIEVWI